MVDGGEGRTIEGLSQIFMVRQILGMGDIPIASQVALFSRRLGLTCAHRSKFAAHWADCLRMVTERHPPIEDMIEAG